MSFAELCERERAEEALSRKRWNYVFHALLWSVVLLTIATYCAGERRDAARGVVVNDDGSAVTAMAKRTDIGKRTP